MSAPPKAVLHAPEVEAAAIRRAVRTVDVATLGPRRVRADLSHVAGLVSLLSDPRVSDPIYDPPRPIREDNVTPWVAEAQAPAPAGQGPPIPTPHPKGARGRP